MKANEPFHGTLGEFSFIPVDLFIYLGTFIAVFCLFLQIREILKLDLKQRNLLRNREEEVNFSKI